MDTITIRQGETLELEITADDNSADTVQLTVADQDGNVIISEIESFMTIGNKRIAVIRTDNTSHPVGEYKYMLTIVYADGFIEKLPDNSSCDDDCELPEFVICESLGQDES